MVVSGKLVHAWSSDRSPRAVTHIRSTLIQSSLQGLRERAHFERYLERLDPARRDEILLTLAPTWMPVEVAIAHYAACDALGLGGEELTAIGEVASQRVMGTFLATLVRKSRAIGGSPWVVAKSYGTLWQRIWQGGAVEVYEEGPKDALFVGYGNPCARFEYFSKAYAGVVKGAIGMFATTVHVSPRRDAAGRLVALARWV